MLLVLVSYEEGIIIIIIIVIIIIITIIACVYAIFTVLRHQNVMIVKYSKEEKMNCKK